MTLANKLFQSFRSKAQPASTPLHPWGDDYHSEASESDIYNCFRLILGRNPSPGEWAGHTSALTGKPLKEVMLSYLTSTEFKERDLFQMDSSEIQVVLVNDYQMYIPINDPQVGSVIFNKQPYEPHVENFIKNNVGPGDCVVDVGANIGYFSMLSASLVENKGKVYAFEPYSENVKMLHLSKEINHFSQLEIIPMAASDQSGLCLFDNAGTNGFIRKMTHKASRVLNSTPVYMTSLDTILPETLDRLDLIKIDTEGAEFLAMQGAIETLQRFKPTVISEFAPDALNITSNATVDDYLNLFLDISDYKLFAFRGEQLERCKGKEELMALFRESGVEHIDIVFSTQDYD